MNLDNLKNRAALAAEFGKAGFRRGAEIGILMGQYSLVLFQHIPDLHLICVDPWTPSRNHRSARALERYFYETREKLKGFDAEIMRMTSLEAAPLVPDESLDFVYIDALHDWENVKADLNAWTPKVRHGGVVAGHDWGHIGVDRAISEYLESHPDIVVHSTIPAEEDWYPSWAWVKA
jgi:predicted O-methyltransferase YrrM